MTKKQLLSMVCTFAIAGAFGSPVFAQPSETGPGDQIDVEVSDNQLAGDDIVEVEVEDSFTTENEAEEGSIANMNGTVTSTETETEYDTEIDAEDGGIANQSGCVTKTETEIEVELSAEEGGMLLAGKGSQEKTEIEDSYNDNREWDFEMEIKDSYNTTDIEDNSVSLRAELNQVATGPIDGNPRFVALSAPDNGDDHAAPLGEVANNKLELCSSFNDWTGINNNVQTVGRHLNGGNLNAIAVGQGFNQ